MPASPDADEANDREDTLLLMAVAKLYKEGTTNQEEIGEKLRNLSQSRVSRIVKELRRQGILEVVVHDERFAAADWDEVERAYFNFTELREELTSRRAYRNVDVEVVPGGQAQFVAGAAPVLLRVLTRSARIGVAWGRILRALAGPMDAIKEQFPHRHKRMVVPVCPDPIYLQNLGQNQEYSASRLAVRMQRIINGDVDADCPVLLGVPAYIPRKFRGKKMDAAMEIFKSIPGYKAIFDKKDGLINKLDTMLTGVGTFSPTDAENDGTFLKERLSAEEEVSRTQLMKLVCGDLAGVLLAHAEPEPPIVQEMGDCWLGINRKHFLNCVARARKEKRPGPVLIASWPAQADAVDAAIRAGLVRTLIISVELAQELTKIK